MEPLHCAARIRFLSLLQADAQLLVSSGTTLEDLLIAMELRQAQVLDLQQIFIADPAQFSSLILPFKKLLENTHDLIKMTFQLRARLFYESKMAELKLRQMHSLIHAARFAEADEIPSQHLLDRYA